MLSLPFSSRDGQWTNFLDSLFTATSATCVTGLVVFDTFRHWSIIGQLVILVLIQIGGMGFISIGVAFPCFCTKNRTQTEGSDAGERQCTRDWWNS